MTEYVGYAKLRPGRIHLFCPGCKRKQSNVPRNVGGSFPDDPPRAVLAHVHCEKCSVGSKDSSTIYLSAHGLELCSYCGERCEKVGMRRRCNERLINEAVNRGIVARDASTKTA